MLIKLALLAVAGGLGTLARYGMSVGVQRLTDSFFPWGTFSVNLIGCFLFAFFWSMVENRIQITSEYRLVVLTGFMGAFTTFSTFMFETGQMIRESQYLWALGNVGLQSILGITAIFLGLFIGKLI